MCRNAFHWMKTSQKGHRWIGKRSESGRNWSELVGKSMDSDVFSVNSDSAHRAARDRGAEPRSASESVFKPYFVFTSCEKSFAMTSNTQILLIHHHHRRNRSENGRNWSEIDGIRCILRSIPTAFRPLRMLF